VTKVATVPMTELHERLVRRELTASELLQEHLEVLQREEPRVRAFIRLTEDLARGQAAEADRRLAAGDAVDMMTGIPIAIKDLICVEGIETTAGSKVLRGFQPPYDATCVARLRQAGAVFLGMTNCDEFGMGSSTENSGYFPTHNPRDPSRVPGGSSGGSAAAVAADEAVIALGTDTGGSSRQPAALCGVVGIKPTYGRVSRYGLIAYASSLDQVGAFSRTVTDAAHVLQTIAGPDPRDATSGEEPSDMLTHLEEGIEGVRLGVPREYFEVEGMEPGVRAAVERALVALEGAGAELVDVSLPHTDYGLAAYYIIAPAEASSNLSRFDSVRYGACNKDATNLLETYMRTRGEGFGPEVRRRIMLGTYALSAGYYEAYYLKAQKVRTLIARDFEKAFQRCDAIVSATSPCVAFPLGAKTDDPLQMYLNDVLTLPCNLAGLPGVNVPCGTSWDLPVGLQVLAPQWEDARALRVARAYEVIRDGA
jgi:aspartyl-tRNA(Asn)/glutamyl-tRNA(Gln) amidotransferase subunit A